MRLFKVSRLSALVAMVLTGAAIGGGNIVLAADMQAFAGFWAPAQQVAELKTADGKAPPLKPLARKYYQAFQAAAAKGDRWFDNELDCLPPGMTRLLTQSPFELIVDPEHVALWFQWNRFVHVAERRSEHPSSYDYPGYLGHTIAYLQGDALVLDSEYFNDETLLDYGGLPHSDKLQLRQVLRLSDANTLVDQLTITDPGAFTTPWITQLNFQRMPAGTRFTEDVCVERQGITKLDAHRRRDAGLKKLGLGEL
ncbi:MAG: hypothetical protein QM718_14685 [Steroidobacteraceae bacterium]